MARVYISYSRRDASDFVNKLATDLKANGVDVFWDQMLTPGDSWANVLTKAIADSDYLVVVLTPASVESPWVRQEWLSALVEEVATGHGKVIPVLYQDCEVPPELAKKFWADFREGYEIGLNALLKAVQHPQEVPPVTSQASPEEVKKFAEQAGSAVKAFQARPQEPPPPAPAPPSPSGKKRCFMVMPFGRDDLTVVYEDFIKPVAEEQCGLEMEKGDDIFGSNPIMDDILNSIQRSDMVIADLTGKNANVFYEVGICHTLNKPVLLLAQSIDDVPFDLRHRRVQIYEYTPRGCKRLEAKLKAHLAAMTGNVAAAKA